MATDMTIDEAGKQVHDAYGNAVAVHISGQWAMINDLNGVNRVYSAYNDAFVPVSEAPVYGWAVYHDTREWLAVVPLMLAWRYNSDKPIGVRDGFGDWQ